MARHERRNLSDGQFGLSFIIYVVTFSCALCAVVSQRSALLGLLWSLLGMVCALRISRTYLRRSVFTMYAGCGLIAVGAFHEFVPPFRDDIFFLGINVFGGILAFSGGFTTLLNAFDRGDDSDRLGPSD